MPETPPVNPRAALPQEATLTHKEPAERQRRIAKIANAVVDGARLTLTIKVFEQQANELVEVDEITKIIPANELYGLPEEVMVRMDTRLEHALIEHHTKTTAASLIDHTRAF